MIRRADIEGSKSNVAMNAWLPQASYSYGNFSDTSSLKFPGSKGSIGHTFMGCIHTENQNQGNFHPFVLLEISVLHEFPLGHLRYFLKDVPLQLNSPPDNVFILDQFIKNLNAKKYKKKKNYYYIKFSMINYKNFFFFYFYYYLFYLILYIRFNFIFKLYNVCL